MKKRILIDLTDLYAWHGVYGGIQRVVYNISEQLPSEAEKIKFETVFMRFDNQANCFYEVSFGALAERNTPNVPIQADENASNFRISERLLRRLSLILPTKAKRVLKKLKPHQTNVQEPIHITESDVVLIMGTSWDNPQIQQYLGQQREVLGFFLVQVVYDLVICLYPHLQNPVLTTPYTNHMKKICLESDILLAISENTKSDLQKFCKREAIQSPKTHVIRLGDEINRQLTSSRPQNIADKFILCVGTIEIRKNHTLLYYTYKLALEKGIKLPQLVIAGSRGWLTGDIQYMLATDPEIKEHIRIVESPKDAELSWLYKNAMFTLYPSMYEGWGLPIAESLAYGTPVLASHASSMKEIAGDKVKYFSPYSTNECLESIQKMIQELLATPTKNHRQISYKSTSWRDTAIQIKEAIAKYQS